MKHPDHDIYLVNGRACFSMSMLRKNPTVMSYIQSECKMMLERWNDASHKKIEYPQKIYNNTKIEIEDDTAPSTPTKSITARHVSTITTPMFWPHSTNKFFKQQLDKLKVLDTRVDGTTPFGSCECNETHDMAYKLTLKQETIFTKIMQSLHKHKGATAIVPTGGGKTIIMSHVISSFGKKTLVVAHRKELVTQLFNKVVTQFESIRKNVKIAVYDQSTKMTIGEFIKENDIIIMTIQKAIRQPNTAFNEDIGLLVVDEAHHLPSDTMQVCVTKVNCATLALTATPERTDKRTMLLYYSCGPICYAETMVCKMPATIHTVVVRDTNLACRDMTEYDMQELIAKDSYINKMVAQRLCSDHENNAVVKRADVVLILTLRTQHARDISKMIEGCYLYVGEDTQPTPKYKHFPNLPHHELYRPSYCLSQKKMVESPIMIKGQPFQRPIARVIVSTYAAFGEGMDVPELNVCFLMAPKLSITQCIGRIARDVEDKKLVVVDVLHVVYKRCRVNYGLRFSEYYDICLPNHRKTTEEIVYNSADFI